MFCAAEPKAGRHFTFVTPDRRGVEFAKALFQLAMSYPEAETVRLVTDHLSTHSRKPLTDPCGEESGGESGSSFTPRYTPRHGGWLHQAEMEMGLFSRQCLGQRRILDLAPPAAASGGLEPPGEPRTGQDRLAIRPQGRAPQGWLQKTIYQTAGELARFSHRVARRSA